MGVEELSEICDAVQSEGIAQNRLRRAKEEWGVVARQHGKNDWWWYLSKADATQMSDAQKESDDQW